jgi:hypothetical protein
MNILLYILKELWALVAEDWFFTFVILAWIGAVACLKPSIPNETWDAPILFIGLLAILLFSVVFTFRPRAPSQTTHPIKP